MGQLALVFTVGALALPGIWRVPGWAARLGFQLQMSFANKCLHIIAN